MSIQDGNESDAGLEPFQHAAIFLVGIRVGTSASARGDIVLARVAGTVYLHLVSAVDVGTARVQISNNRAGSTAGPTTTSNVPSSGGTTQALSL